MKPVFIIGYRCTGKTSVGKYLARALGWSYTDADDVLVARVGKNVSEFVEDQGWGAFRDMESEILSELSISSDQVISTGGGVILRPENIEILNTSGFVVWLTATVESIVERMTGDAQTVSLRPALGGKSATEEVADVLAERTALYQKASEVQIATDDLTIEAVGDAIISVMKQNQYFSGLSGDA